MNRSTKILSAGLLVIAAACAAEKVKTLQQAEAENAAAQAAKAPPAPMPVAQASPPPPLVAAPPTVPPPPPKPALPPGVIDSIVLPADTKAGVAIELRFRSGSVDDPPGKSGLTALAARTMVEGGAGPLDAKAFLEALYPIAATIRVRVDREETTFIANVHHAALDKLVPILADVLVKPRWEAKEFERLRASAISEISKSLRQARDEDLGKEALEELMYRGHPYGRLIDGHVSDLKSVTLEDVKAQAARVFTLDRLTIGIAGGYPKELPDRLQKAFATLPAHGAPQVVIPQLTASVRHPRLLLVEKQSASTAISLGTPWSLSRNDPDWAALSVARSAIGEHRQQTGRLMARLRELRGLNYGDYAYIEYFRQEGGDASQAQSGRARHQQEMSIWLRPVQNDNRLFALRGALYELNRSLTDEPFSDEEVARTKGFLDGYILLFDQTDARKLGYALDGDFLGIQGFLHSWHQSLDGVDAAQVNAAWKKWVHPEDLQIVMAGPDMAALKAQILSNAPSPIHYASGSNKPQEILDTDKKIEAFPLGITDADIEVIPVEKLFE